MLVLLLCLLLNVQCCVVGMPLRDCDESSVDFSCHVGMRLFHEMYSSFCRTGIGGDCFFRNVSQYDPPSPENDYKTLEERYDAWRKANHVELPPVKVVALVSMELCHEAYRMYRLSISEGEDDIFFDVMNQYDPPTLENGMKTLEERYAAWRSANSVELPTIGHGFVRVPS